MIQEKLPLILSVDDERYNLKLLERVLSSFYRVVSVTNAGTALDMLAQAPFDLILLDVMMPEIDGLHLLEMIRSKPKFADIPIILVSALSDGRDVARGLEAGANDYIIKPIDMDITLARVRTQIALKKLQDERTQTIAELRSVQEMKDRLLQMASHDLKGPLGNIRMATALMESSLDANSEGASLMQSVDSSVETMLNVIKDFLDTAAVQTGALDLHLGSVSVEVLVKDVITEHRVNALRKNIEVQTYDLEEMIRADYARLHQVVGNLVSNAIKYSPRDTTITIWSECDDTTVTLYVADQGLGIPAGERDRLFTQFGKLSPRPTGGENSTGLGLWIVKHLVTLQSGHVGLISPPEGGSIFWVQMPAAELEVQRSDAAELLRA